MKTGRKLLSVLLTVCMLLALASPALALKFTDAHGNEIELDETLEAYAEAALTGADNAARKRETNLGDLWTDALRWFAASGKINDYFEEDDVTAGNTAIAVDADHIVALWNGGNLRADIPAGTFNAETLANVLPYPNKVAVVYMTGAQLLEALEAASQGLPYGEASAAACASFMQVSGLKYTLDLSKTYDRGEEYKAPWYKAASVARVTITEVNGQAFDPEATYAVITSNANFNGMDSSYIFKEAADANDRSTITTAVVRDVIWMYLGEVLENVIKEEEYGKAQGRITLLFTDAHGNVITLDDEAEAYATVKLSGADDAARKGETNLGDLWTDALRWFAASGKINEFFEEDDVTAGNDALAVDAEHVVALWNGGNLRADIEVGVFGAAQLAEVLPYPNKVAVVYMTGAQLLEALEAASQGLPYGEDTASVCASFMQVSGLKYTVDLGKAYDQGEEYKTPWYKAASLGRVTIDEINGQPFDPAATYAVITSNANYNGMDSSYIFKAAAEENDKSTITTAVVREVVWMYLQDQLAGTVSGDYAEPQGRITLVSGTPKITYPDVAEDAWYAPYVSYVSAEGLMMGTGKGFDPSGVTTRAQLITVIYRLAGSPTVEAEGDAWYAEARAWAMNEEISDGARMTDKLTRQEAVTMLYRWVQKQGKGFTDTWMFELEYPDAADVAEWADEAMHWMVMNEVINGKSGKLAPKDTLTRAEMAKILTVYIQLP